MDYTSEKQRRLNDETYVGGSIYLTEERNGMDRKVRNLFLLLLLLMIDDDDDI
jgi:hypothetical protein